MAYPFSTINNRGVDQHTDGQSQSASDMMLELTCR